MKIITLLLSAFAIATSTLAGDGNPTPMKRIQIDFDSPYRGDKDYKVTRVALIVQLDRKGNNAAYKLQEVRPVSISVDLGKRTLRLPDVIQRDLTQMDISSAHFSMGPGYSFRLAFTGKLADETGEIVLFWRSDALREDPALIGLQFDHKDYESRYPGIFKPHP